MLCVLAEAGDRVLLYMPMIPEAAVAMLACTRIGAVHSVVFGGFAAAELAVRIDDATPKVCPEGEEAGVRSRDGADNRARAWRVRVHLKPKPENDRLASLSAAVGRSTFGIK